MSFKEANQMSDVEIAQVLDFADIVGGWLKAVRAEGFKRAHQRNGAIPGYKLTAGQASWQYAVSDEVILEFAAKHGFKIPANFGASESPLFVSSLISPAQLKALLKSKYKGRGHEAVWREYDKLVKNVGGASTSLVRETDARDEVKRGHEFKEIAAKVATTEKKEVEDLL